MTIELNPSLDLQKLAADFRMRGRAQVRDVLTDASAETLLEMLEAVPWGLAFNDGANVTQLDAAAVARLDRRDAAAIMAGIHERARSRFQFLYAFYPLFSAYFTPGLARQPLFEAFEFVNSKPMVGLVRKLTGNPAIRWADAQATLFRAGHFLQRHSDQTPGGERAAAYVLNFTKDWGADWGGYLQFFNEAQDVEEAYRPRFNALNVFAVPADHSVSPVSPYVRAGRFSITGWFRTDDPPAAIGG